MLLLASASPRRQEILRAAEIPHLVRPSNIQETRLPGEPGVDFTLRMAIEKANAIAFERPEDIVLAADTMVLVDDAVLGKPLDDADVSRMLRMLSGRPHRVVTGFCLRYAVRGSSEAHKPPDAAPNQKGTSADFAAPGESVVRGSSETKEPQVAVPCGAGPRPAAGSQPAFQACMRSSVTASSSEASVSEVCTTIVEFAPLTEIEIADYTQSGEGRDKAGGYAIQGRAGRFVRRIDGCYYNVVGLPLSAVYRHLRNLNYL